MRQNNRDGAACVWRSCKRRYIHPLPLWRFCGGFLLVQVSRSSLSSWRSKRPRDWERRLFRCWQKHKTDSKEIPRLESVVSDGPLVLQYSRRTRQKLKQLRLTALLMDLCGRTDWNEMCIRKIAHLSKDLKNSSDFRDHTRFSFKVLFIFRDNLSFVRSM